MVEGQVLPEALRSEILKLTKEGDTKKEGALTPEVLLRIMRVAKTGREVLVSLEASPSNLSKMVKRPRSGGFISGIGQTDEEEIYESAAPGVMPYAMAPASENFGMTAIRELIAAAKNFNGNGSSPVKLVEALAIAKEKGLDDVAKELEKQLGMKSEEKPSVAVKPTEKEKP